MKRHMRGVALLCCLIASGCATQAPVTSTARKSVTGNTMQVINHAEYEKPPVLQHYEWEEWTRWDLDTLRKFPSVVVEFEATIDEEGVPGEIAILRSEDENIGAAVVRAFQKWRFSPALKEGKPARCRVVIRLVAKGSRDDASVRAPYLMRQIY